MYIRPTMISMWDRMGVDFPMKAKLYVILSPVGNYFAAGMAGVRIICNDPDVVRSWPAGFGGAKIGANYAPTLGYYKEIKSKGYDQILWLIDDNITEVGVMNFFVYWVNKQGETELITCPLNGTILPGITRDSVISLCKEWGVKVTEREFTIKEVVEAFKEDRILEAFGTGTAAVICPIKDIVYKDTSYVVDKIGNKPIGELGRKLYDNLLDIQTGVTDHPWSHVFG
jgi:branched-chain amino acid aminotransferase